MSNVYSDKDLQMFGDFDQVFGSEEGKRVLKWMEKFFGVRETVEPEEQLNTVLRNQGELKIMGICPIGLAKRKGLQAAYWKIVAMVEEAKRLRKERKSVE
jgi:hypothetical protein